MNVCLVLKFTSTIMQGNRNSYERRTMFFDGKADKLENIMEIILNLKH